LLIIQQLPNPENLLPDEPRRKKIKISKAIPNIPREHPKPLKVIIAN